MSQRTRGPTTGAATHKPSEEGQGELPRSAARGTRARPPQRTAPEPAQGVPAEACIDAAAIARVLRVMADEVERDSALAQRVADATAGPAVPSSGTAAPGDERTGRDGAARSAGMAAVGAKPFKARIVTGAAAELGAGIPDPFALRAQLGRDGLQATLEELRLGTLRAMIREYRLGEPGPAARHGDAARMRQVILTATEARRSPA